MIGTNATGGIMIVYSWRYSMRILLLFIFFWISNSALAMSCPNDGSSLTPGDSLASALSSVLKSRTVKITELEWSEGTSPNTLVFEDGHLTGWK